MIETFIFYPRTWEAGIKRLSLEQRGALLTAVINHALDKEVPDLDLALGGVFDIITSRIQEDKDKYAEVVDKRKAAGKKGGQAKAQNLANVANASNAKQNLANVANASFATPPICHENVNDNENVNVSDNENVNENVNDIDTPPIAPQGGQDAQAGKRPAKDAPICAEDWERWYAAYPKHEGKQTAIRAWNKAHKEGVLPSIETLLDTLTWQKQRWTDPQYIPMPSSYLNGRRWQDEKPAPQPQPMNGYPRFQQTGKLQGEALHEHNMEVARIVLAQRAQARAEGKPASPLAALTN